MQSQNSWYVYDVFSSAVDGIIETPSLVYYTSAGNLFSYDKDSDETYAYTPYNKLNGNQVKAIYYNYDKDYLLVVYDDSNIDFIYDDGHVVNMPDIKDAINLQSRIINDVKFHDGKVYIATTFGIVVYDDVKHEVIESGVYNKNTYCLEIIGDKLMICCDYDISVSPLDARHNSLNAYTFIMRLNSTDFKSFGEGVFLTRFGSEIGPAILRIVVDMDSHTVTDNRRINLSGTPSEFREYKDGVYIVNPFEIVLFDVDGNMGERIPIPAPLQGKELSFWESPYKIWIGDGGGIARYDITDGNITVLSDKFKPDGLTCKAIAHLIPSPDGQRIYISNQGPSQYYKHGTGDAYDDAYQRVNIIENGEVRDVTLTEASAHNNFVVEARKQKNSTAWFGAPGVACEDMTDPSVYYCANAMEGVYVVKDGKEVGKFNSLNAPIVNLYGRPGARNYYVAVDPEGNLWMVNQSEQNYESVIILPKNKLKGDLSKIKKDDWVKLPLGSFSYMAAKDVKLLFCRHSKMVFIADGHKNHPLVAYDTKGTYADISDDKHYIWGELTDQDGKKFTKDVYYTCLVEDKRGRVWVGSDDGIFEISNPVDAMNPSMRINRLKVPRNDGTNYADYLLGSIKVNDIAVDHSNRKWIATESDGVYLVSENGDEILEHFSTSNSYLPSNAVQAVECDPLSNVVYFGTNLGLASYKSSSSPAMEDFSEVYAYPNPVKPGYSGPVTIKGLMDKSLVKIADNMGNVVFQGRSEGGMMVWDGNNQSGHQVRSGLYYVFVSQSKNENSTGAVTKILIIR
jgi:hypothetical protein